MKFKPMLAAPINLNNLHYPVMASYKLDGVRATVVDGKLVSRSLKPIPNEYVRSLFEKKQLEGLDGELIVGNPNDPSVFNKTVSVVMSKTKIPDQAVYFYVFDDIYSPDNFFVRYKELKRLSESGFLPGNVELVQHRIIRARADLNKVYNQALSYGFEGLILRDPDKLYKFGRSTAKEQGMLKYKPFVDAEATVVDVLEEMHNGNEATINELGYTERSSHKENKTGTGRVGALQVTNTEGVTFRIGVFKNVTKDELRDWWLTRDDLIGRTVKYSYLPVGVKDAPRHPKFLGWRHEDDK